MMNQILNPQDFELSTATPLDQAALDRLFRSARTHSAFLPRPVPRSLLREAVELAKMGPTAVNSSPMRVVFLDTDEARQLLLPAVAEGNVAKVKSAPVTAIVGHDHAFHDRLPELFPHADAKAWFTGKDDFRVATASHNGALQEAYFIMALRGLGLDTGPMGGFDKAKVDEAFFAGTDVKSSLLINIGYGDDEKLHPRSPRLAFDDMAQFT